jgi:hypothetical protein
VPVIVCGPAYVCGRAQLHIINSRSQRQRAFYEVNAQVVTSQRRCSVRRPSILIYLSIHRQAIAVSPTTRQYTGGGRPMSPPSKGDISSAR